MKASNIDFKNIDWSKYQDELDEINQIYNELKKYKKEKRGMKKILASVIMILFAIIETKFFITIGDIYPELEFILGQMTIVVINIVSILVKGKLYQEEFWED